MRNPTALMCVGPLGELPQTPSWYFFKMKDHAGSSGAAWQLGWGSKILVHTRADELYESEVSKQLQLLTYLRTYVVVLGVLGSQFLLKGIHLVKGESREQSFHAGKSVSEPSSTSRFGPEKSVTLLPLTYDLNFIPDDAVSDDFDLSEHWDSLERY